MTSDAALMQELRELPRSERRAVLEKSVATEFKAALLMGDEESLPSGQSYFDLGLTSLGLMQVKERLETQLGAGISATVLFNHPTVRHLLEHLVADVLHELFTNTATATRPMTAAEAGDVPAMKAAKPDLDRAMSPSAIWADTLKDLYEN